MDIFERAGIDAGYVILGLLAVDLILIILFLLLFVQHSKMKKRYQTFLQGESGNNLEKSILKKFSEIDRLSRENEVLMADVKKIMRISRWLFKKLVW